MTFRDAYEAGRYVTRHPRSQGAADRSSELGRTVDACYSRGQWERGNALQAAWMLGRDRFARMGEH